MDFRFANDNEIANWDRLILDNFDSGNIIQSKELTEFKRHSGWKPVYLIAENSEYGDLLAVSVQEKKVFGLGKFWYIAKGPGLNILDLFPDFIDSLKEFARKQSVFTVKLEPEILKTEENIEELKYMGLVPSRAIQPNYSTILLDISSDEEQILASFPRGGAKYSINRARRDGVTVERVETNLENSKIFYNLLVETGKDSGFKTRSFDYYFNFWRIFAENNLGQMFFAKFEGEVVAVAFGLIFGKKSTYKDGASIRKRKAYGASHLLQWEVIRWAREKGAKVHDLCGTPPSDKISDKSYFLHGVGQFKSSFSKHVTDYVGGLDLVISPKKYKIWIKFVEKAILKFYRRVFNRNWY